MPGDMQLRLPIGISLPTNTPELIKAKRKHGLILGRPRRLQPGSAVIKVAITPSKVKIIDRLRSYLAGHATRPEAIRVAVVEFVGAHADLMGNPTAETLEMRPATPGRCEYWKIPFPPDVIEIIGHQAKKKKPEESEFMSEKKPVEIIPATGLCAVFGVTRQGLVNKAIDYWQNKCLG